MSLPADFDAALWPDPLMFQGLVGSSIAMGCYKDLFREDGFCKPLADLRKHPRIAKHIDKELAERAAWRAANPRSA